MKKESVPKSGTFCQKFHKIEIREHIGIVKRRPKRKKTREIKEKFDFTIFLYSYRKYS